MPKRPKHKTNTLAGVVASRNISPKGHVEGVIVKRGEALAQINFPKHAEPALALRFAIGATVDVPVELVDDEGDHPVYEVSEDRADARGTIARLNYARHGEVNGYQLEDGTFVHVKPDGARRYKLRVGDRITAKGARRTGADAAVIEAEHVAKQK